MNYLLAAATRFEIEPTINFLKQNWSEVQTDCFTNGHNSIQILIHGVGMVSTAYQITKLLENKNFDCAIQAGIAGSFDKNLLLGEVVLVSDEQFGDLGTEDKYQFLDLFDLGFQNKNEAPFNEKKINSSIPKRSLNLNQIKNASGITVNMVSGTDFTAEQRKQKFNCTVESMEGAAFHYVCAMNKMDFFQLRAISNYVEVRDKSKWKIEEAIENLNEQLKALFVK